MAIPETATWSMLVGGFSLLAFGQKLRRRKHFKIAGVHVDTGWGIRGGNVKHGCPRAIGVWRGDHFCNSIKAMDTPKPSGKI